MSALDNESAVIASRRDPSISLCFAQDARLAITGKKEA
jgi:hypothetical protein